MRAYRMARAIVERRRGARATLQRYFRSKLANRRFVEIIFSARVWREMQRRAQADREAKEKAATMWQSAFRRRRAAQLVRRKRAWISAEERVMQAASGVLRSVRSEAAKDVLEAEVFVEQRREQRILEDRRL